MNAGKITEYVFGVCKGLVGRFAGGLAHVNVLASLVFSGMTGSAVADASGLGKMEIDAMRAEGYDDTAFPAPLRLLLRLSARFSRLPSLLLFMPCLQELP